MFCEIGVGVGWGEVIMGEWVYRDGTGIIWGQRVYRGRECGGVIWE